MFNFVFVITSAFASAFTYDYCNMCASVPLGLFEGGVRRSETITPAKKAYFWPICPIFVLCFDGLKRFGSPFKTILTLCLFCEAGR